MSTGIGDEEEGYFSVEEIMSYSDVKLVHANDDNLPIKNIVIRWKVSLATLLIALAIILFSVIC